MDNTAITLKFTEQEFAEVQEAFHTIGCKLGAIGHIDLRAISDDISFGHYLLIDDVSKQLHTLLRQLESARVPEK